MKEKDLFLKIVFKIIFFAVIAILFAIAMNSMKSGHVIIFVANYRLDFSLISLFLILFLILLILYYLINIVSGLQNLPSAVKLWFNAYTTNKRHKYLNAAIISFLAKDYKKTHKIALKAIDKSMKNQTSDKFIALCLAAETANDTQNRHFLVDELSRYDTRNYKLAKEVIIKGLRID